jgi:Carboxypeptidase regulatory-like domain
MRTAVTDVNGVYTIRGLPPGRYTVRFEMDSFRASTNDAVNLTVGGTAEANQTMVLASVTETVNVVANTTPTALATVTTSTVYNKTELDALPVGRTPAQIAELAPGLTNNTPNTGQVTIAGAFAYDNVFMLNGVDINDNLFGSPHDLYIEDAIQETNIMTNGISAEWGRFSGGVINMVTKSGGNTFTGSFRENLSNPKWIDETPREDSASIKHQDILSKTHEGTFGGPIMRDKIWFFTAGRYENSNTPYTTVQTNIAYTTQVTNKRGELKGTGTILPGQTVQASYINNSTEQANTSGLGTTLRGDPNILVTRQLPNRLFAANYNGILAKKFFTTVQYSEKKFGFRNTGGTSTAIADSPFRSRGVATGVPTNVFYNAPYFDSADPENRNNRQIAGSVAYTFSTRRGGSHDLKAGAERYTSTRTGGNSQSSTGYVFRADYLVSGTTPVVDSAGTPVPIFVPGTTRLESYIVNRGAEVNIHTTSLYLQDHWIASPRLSLDLGTRFEAVRGKATGDILTVDTNTIVPRLGATYDLTGNGRTLLQGSYALYAGKYQDSQFARNTDVGNPSAIVYGYSGPAGEGMDFAPGFSLANYTQIIGGSFPTANVFADPGIKSPTTQEITFGVGRELGQKGFAKATYMWRNTHDFVEDFITLANGQTTVIRNGTNFGTFNNVVFSNTDAKRDYAGIVLQSSYRPRDVILIGGSYTLQLTNEGNYTGEAANQPAIVTVIGDYPEIYGPSLDRLQPDGRLYDYQRHKIRLYGVYTQRMGRIGSLDFAPIWRVNSPQVYSLVASNVPISAVELARNPGYPVNDINPNTSHSNLFFGERGSQDFAGYGILDFSSTYSVPMWKTIRPWVKVELFNLLNNQKLVAWDTTVTADVNSPMDSNGLRTGYVRGPRFGTATQDTHFASPIPGIVGGRLFRMAFGLRF